MVTKTRGGIGTTNLVCHVGGTLHNLARYYPTLSEVVDELIQNALDAKATFVHLRIRLASRFISIRDNGSGMSQKTFDTKVSRSIGHSIKSKDDLGQFGIGFISPIGKCEYFEVTSCASPNKNTYTTWTFRLNENDADAEIPWRDRGDLRFAPNQANSRSGTNIWWRTAIELYNFKKDATMMDVTLRGIANSALMKYSGKMQKLGTRLKVELTDANGNSESTEVSAATFTGSKLDEKIYHTDNAGKVVVRMYLAKHQGTQSRVNVKFGELGNDFRFPFSNFRVSTAKDLLSSEAMSALGSGIFEGEILGHKVKLTPSRTCFEKNDALVDLCICLENWFEEQGREYLDLERRERKMERYQNIGHRVIGMIEKIFKSESGSILRDNLRKFLNGTAGVGHIDLGGKEYQDDTSITNTGRSKKRAKKTEKESMNDKKRSKENDVAHLSVIGPNGNHRKIVKGGSFGLQYAYDELPDSPKLWELDLDFGVIVFNTMHPDWVSLDKKGTSDWRLCALMEHVTLQALTLLTMEPAAQRHQRRFADEYTKHIVNWLLLGGAMPLGKRNNDN